MFEKRIRAAALKWRKKHIGGISLLYFRVITDTMIHDESKLMTRIANEDRSRTRIVSV